MIASPPKPGDDGAKLKEAMKRKLKELQLFQGPGSLVVLTWDDLAVDLGLAMGQGSGGPRGEAVDAARIGLAAVLLPTGGAADLHPEARVRGGHRFGTMHLTRHDVAWDGKDFKVVVREVDLLEGASSVAL